MIRSSKSLLNIERRTLAGILLGVAISLGCCADMVVHRFKNPYKDAIKDEGDPKIEEIRLKYWEWHNQKNLDWKRTLAAYGGMILIASSAYSGAIARERLERSSD